MKSSRAAIRYAKALILESVEKDCLEEMNSDMHASPEYRANLVSLYAKKAVEAC